MVENSDEENSPLWEMQKGISEEKEEGDENFVQSFHAIKVFDLFEYLPYFKNSITAKMCYCELVRGLKCPTKSISATLGHYCNLQEFKSLKSIF
jgi:hypothetical protein